MGFGRSFLLCAVLIITQVNSAWASDAKISLDLDGDGQTLALTDGVILLRGLFGFEGQALVANALSDTAVYSDPKDIAARIANLREYLDVDSDGRVTGLTDGLIILRSLFGFQGEALTAGATSSISARTDPALVADFVRTLRDGFYLEKDLIRLPEPDLASLTYGSPTVYLMEPRGFSEDGALLLVRTTYLDDGDVSVSLRYSIDVWNVDQEAFVSNIALDAFGEEGAREYDLREAVIVGEKDSYSILAKARNKNDDSERLIRMINNELVSPDVLSDFLGLQSESKIESFMLSPDDRFIALQTSDSIFAPETNPDTNDTSDVYILDQALGEAHRVCELAGAETYSPCYLKSFAPTSAELVVAFVSTSAFVSPSQIDTNSSDPASPEIDRWDLYLWTKTKESSVVSSGQFTLVSVDSDGVAAGSIDYQDEALIVGDSVFFSSSSDQIEVGDSNGEIDGFVFRSDSAVALGREVLPELDRGGRFVGSDESGRFVLLLTSSSEVADNQAQQLIRIDRQENSFLVTSSNPYLADDWVINGAISASGGRVAFTSNASNLVSGPFVSVSGDLYVKVYF